MRTTTAANPSAPALPLVRRFPAIGELPRIQLGRFPTPIERVEVPVTGEPARTLWIKRDDRSGEPLGGNKLRALEFLLARTSPGDTVLTVGGRGSTHALTTVRHAHALGARAAVVRWRQEMNPDAERVADCLARQADLCIDAYTPVDALLVALALRLRPRVRWVPAGGTSPLGMLGHVNAALELADQVESGVLPPPARVVVPLGSGGTAAGLALGFAIAGLHTTLIGARVVPRIVASRARVLALARRAARLIRRITGERVPLPSPARVQVAHEVYGGAYGRATQTGSTAASRLLEACGLVLDATYSAKACAAALAACGVAPTLFWLTFDDRGIRAAACGDAPVRPLQGSPAP